MTRVDNSKSQEINLFCQNLHKLSPWLLVPEIKLLTERRLTLAWINDFTPQASTDYSYHLLCAGIEIKQPQFDVEHIGSKNESQLVLDIEIN